MGESPNTADDSDTDATERPGEEFYRLEPDGTEIDRHRYSDGQWIFFADSGPAPTRRVALELRSRGGEPLSVHLRFWCAADKMKQIPDTGDYDLAFFVLDDSMPCDVEFSMKDEALARYGKTLLDIKDWDRRATYDDDGVFPAVDLRFYRLDRFAQIQPAGAK